MRKAVLIIGAIILLISVIMLTGGLYEKYFSIPFVIEYGEKTLFKGECPVTLWRYGMKTRQGSYLALYKKTLTEGRTPVEALNFISEGLGDKMAEYADSLKVEPKNAEIIVLSEKPYFKYTSDIPGIDVDMICFGEAVAEALDKGKAKVVTKKINASVTREILINRTERRGGYITNFATSTAERKSNIRLALSAINGTVIEPQELFSFNTVVGPRTEAKGYKTAKIISNGEFIAGVGGGVCQVSTTVYNAALLAELEIVTATHHSLPIWYVPPSRDAMVTSATDFVFKNNTDYPVYIFASSKDNRAEVIIFGIKKEGQSEFESVVKKELSFKNKALSGEYLSGSDLKDYTLLRSGKNGLVSELYIVKGDKRIKLRSDVYAPQDALWQRTEAAPDMYIFLLYL